MTPCATAWRRTFVRRMLVAGDPASISNLFDTGRASPTRGPYSQIAPGEAAFLAQSRRTGQPGWLQITRRDQAYSSGCHLAKELSSLSRRAGGQPLNLFVITCDLGVHLSGVQCVRLWAHSPFVLESKPEGLRALVGELASFGGIKLMLGPGHTPGAGS